MAPRRIAFRPEYTFVSVIYTASSDQIDACPDQKKVNMRVHLAGVGPLRCPLVV